MHPKSSSQYSNCFHCIRRLRHHGLNWFRMRDRCRHHHCIIRMRNYRLQWQLKQVQLQWRLSSQQCCWQQRRCIQCFWTWLHWLCMHRFRLIRCMDIRIQFRFLRLQRIWRHSPLILHCILGFRMRLNNQLIIILRMTREFRFWWSLDLPMIQLWKRPSMIHIVLSF